MNASLNESIGCHDTDIHKTVDYHQGDRNKDGNSQDMEVEDEDFEGNGLNLMGIPEVDAPSSDYQKTKKGRISQF